MNNEMVKNTLLVALVTFVGMCTSFAQTHVHDEGQVLIGQEQNNWLVQISIPAVNVFGFEHAPETDDEQQAVMTFKSHVNEGRMLSVTDNCNIASVEDETNTQHLGQNHSHDHSHSHDKHENVEFTYRLMCQPGEVVLTFTLFSYAPSLERLESQWITDLSQGAKTLTRTNNQLSFTFL